MWRRENPPGGLLRVDGALDGLLLELLAQARRLRGAALEFPHLGAHGLELDLEVVLARRRPGGLGEATC